MSEQWFSQRMKIRHQACVKAIFVISITLGGSKYGRELGPGLN
jgi:hypothetical protein